MFCSYLTLLLLQFVLALEKLVYIYGLAELGLHINIVLLSFILYEV